MGAVASTVAASVLGHSDAEKAFRPWWDNFQDHLIYGLIMLGEFYNEISAISLVTQPMLQHRPNRTELRSMDFFIQILCI